MKLNFNSYYLELANKTLNWLPMDTEELYQKNLKKRFNDLKQYKWIDKVIEYKFNSHGFRCDEFTNSASIMFVGCSLTVGIGIPEQDRWTNIISKKLNLQCYNLGVGGSSSDTAFRLTYGWIDKLNPSILIFLRPPGIRIELVNSNKIENFLISNSNDYFLKEWSTDDNNSELNFLKNYLAIENICKLRKIKCLVDNGDFFYQNENKIDLARDLMHPGCIVNSKFAEYILSKL